MTIKTLIILLLRRAKIRRELNVLIRAMFKYVSTGAGEVARWVRAPDACAEDPGLVPSTHMLAHLQFQGI